MSNSRSALVARLAATALGACAAGIGLPSEARTPAAASPQAPSGPALAGPTAPAPRGRNPLAFAAHVAATVNDEVISTYDLQQRMLLLIVTSGVQPTEQNAPELQREALRGLIDERLQLQEIRRVQTKQKVKVEPTDKEIDDELSDLARANNMKLEGLARQLASAGVSIDTLRDQVRAQIAWRRYMGGRFGSSIRITDEQINATRTRLNAAAAKPQFLVSEIYLEAQRVGGIDVARNGAQQLLEQLKQGAPFAAVARQFSASASASNGGDDGWLVSGEMQPPIQAALQGLSPGELSAPVETPDGVYIFLLRDRRAGASSLMVNLKQAWTTDASPASEANLAALKAKVRGCDGFEDQAKKIPGLSYGETGEVDIVQLSPEVKAGLADIKPGQTSSVLSTPYGTHVVALCSRRQGDSHEPTKTDIENRLYGEELSMLSKRFLRDLHNSATIEAR